MKNRIPSSRRLAAIALALATIALAPRAMADGSKDLESVDARGFGDTTMRLGASATMVSGDGELGDANTGTTTVGSYKRTQLTLDMDVYGFWDATRFDTLIGAEFLMRLGTGGTEKFDAGDGRGGLFFRSDFAFDYALVHWDGDVRGRISFGAGAGMDFGARWYGTARFYPQLVGRVQLWFGDLGVHASWHHLPACSGEFTDREHRFEVGVGTGPIHGGVRYTMTSIRTGDGMSTPNDETLKQGELGIFVMTAF